MGRKLQHFDESSKSTKRRKVQTIQGMYTVTEIEHACLSNLRDSGKMKLANKISELLSKDKDEDESETVSNNVVKFTVNECLALFEDAKLSKHQYHLIRTEVKAKKR